MYIPSSTYRVQLHKEFTFRHLSSIIDYLKQLGVSTIYASPILRATSGSMHGYDVTDPHTINPEIGTHEELKVLSEKLKQNKMSWLQDIVPNHMAFNIENERLMDVLERGDGSLYYNYFDIDWSHPSKNLSGKLCTPFLGKERDECIDAGEIKLCFSKKGFTVDYFDAQYPLSIKAYHHMLAITTDEPSRELLTKIIDHSGNIKSLAEWSEYKTKLIQQIENIHVDAIIRACNEPAALKQILDDQYYSLTFWQHADREINYRRFFTVNELICLRMEDNEVFEEYHQLLYELYKENIIQGFRIDHIDGLGEPGVYIDNLRKKFGNDAYIIAEKILEAKEDMPSQWKLQGTSGYEFLAHVNQLTTEKKGSKQLVKFYKDITPEQIPYKLLVQKNKTMILETYMQGEWENLVQLFFELDLQNNFERPRIKKSLAAFMISLPVYRIYPEKLPLENKDIVILKEAVDKALATEPACKTELEYIFDLFTKPQSNSCNAFRFLKRLMQFTGPLTAKGVEDTTFYLYNPLISHDEVGDAPSKLGISIQEFHGRMSKRLKDASLSLNATNTHDTKRGEDSRIRLNVLSEMPDAWERLVRRWFDVNKAHRQDNHGRRIPSANDEYFIYQAIVGGFPEDNMVTDEWTERLKVYLTKALREAKRHSNWTTPDTVYEEGCIAFTKSILTPGSEFMISFVPFAKEVCAHASLYALVQVLLKCMSPGIPDIYQGCEMFDLSFVDPDNRRPVDYEKRKTCLKTVEQQERENPKQLFYFLETSRTEGYEKLFLTWRILNFRKDHHELFLHGSYIPLQISGTENNTMAFARQKDQAWVIAVLPATASKGIISTGEFLLLPEEAPTTWIDIFTNVRLEARDRKISTDELLRDFPVSVIKPDLSLETIHRATGRSD